MTTSAMFHAFGQKAKTPSVLSATFDRKSFACEFVLQWVLYLTSIQNAFTARINSINYYLFLVMQKDDDNGGDDCEEGDNEEDENVDNYVWQFV